MRTVVDLVIATLQAGMTDGYTEDDQFFVKTWYTADPLAFQSTALPAGAVLAMTPASRSTVFVGMDTLKDTIAVRLFQGRTRAEADPTEVAAGITRLWGMVERAEVLLRTDPTFGAQFVSSEIMSVNPLMPAVNAAVSAAEITLEIRTRALWGS